MDRPVASVTLMIGMVMGLVVGIAYAVARRAWRDYRTVKRSVPGLKKTAWRLLGAVLTRGGIVVLLCLAAVSWAAIGDR